MISLLEPAAAMSPPALPDLKNEIHLVRGERVMLDSALAEIYGVPTKRLNQQLRRNRKRFPQDFAFQLTTEEFANLRSQIATSSSERSREGSNLRSQNVTSSYGGRRYRPWVFTEHGAIMLATVLNSEIAVQASVRVVRAFVQMRELVSANAVLARKLTDLEKKSDTHDHAIAQLFQAIRSLIEPPPAKKRQIGFHVQERADRYRASKKV
ncbi:MAG TPA: ORF6N domain-containing protein [Chthoniobacterales bacterium]|nr:ORF6N domain-containing protein [Chthoniobacterales bacterium]